MTQKYSKDEAALKALNPEQYEVTQNGGTEPPFRNVFWDHKEAGLYVDIVSGEPLFTSLDKFDSHCGWPSFTTPLISENVEEFKDVNVVTYFDCHSIQVPDQTRLIWA